MAVPPPGRCPPLVLIAGPCRSGTTALLQAAACAGHRCYFQPFKGLLRRTLLGIDARFAVPGGREPIVVKETFGPFIGAEAELDPLGLLLDSGYPAERIHVVAVLRRPEAVYRSWRRWFQPHPVFGGVDDGVFTRSYDRPEELYEAAGGRGAAATAYTPDAFADADPLMLLERLFARVGLRFSPAAVDWSGRPPLGAAGSAVVREPEPGPFRAPGSLDAVRASAAYADPGVLTPGPAGCAEGPPSVERLRAVYRLLRGRACADLRTEA